ncbi:acyl-CoA N-acyltransferase [Mytilinidion resinicola]|uniref:Acyl-CoA N-acyltransferase n=1 Tax=Mytilinidion resinicola TaxID=574789 RepID=A0A6A6YBS3_9PEZI|nr:acyl-CoA N-acyltransferase [Mytilinidion resinicola]KAF2806276.1 acyl-CoA N-acyltransferase [Mytilinidion resinicola]
MLIRPLIRADLSSVAPIVHDTFSGDELFTWLYPHQEKYPNDLRRFQLIRLRSRLVQLGSHGFVAESEPGDAEWNGAPEILGFAFYIREGSDEKAARWRQDSIAKRLDRYLLSWEQWYEEKALDRASDPARAKIMREATQYKFTSQLESYWYLGLLGVSPKHQRRGIGAKLVAYGQRIAEEEKMPVTLEASVMGRGLYAKLGFKEIERLAIVEGLEGVAMLWEPEGAEGTWLVRGEDGKAELKKKETGPS